MIPKRRNRGGGREPGTDTAPADADCGPGTQGANGEQKTTQPWTSASLMELGGTGVRKNGCLTKGANAQN